MKCLTLSSVPLLAVLLTACAPGWTVRNSGAPFNTEYHEAFSSITKDGLTPFVSSDVEFLRANLFQRPIHAS